MGEYEHCKLYELERRMLRECEREVAEDRQSEMK